MNGRTEVLRVDHRVRHYIVVSRNGPNYEPLWAVIGEGSGAEVSSVAHFFDQTDALEYANFRNRKENK